MNSDDECQRQAELWQQRYERLLKDIEDELQRDSARTALSYLLLQALAKIYRREKAET